MSILENFRRDERGNHAIEFAFIAIAVITLIMVVFDLARAFWTKSTLQSVAEETVRCYALGKPQYDSGDTTVDCGTNSLAVDYAYDTAMERAVTLSSKSDAQVYDSGTTEAADNCGSTTIGQKTMVYVYIKVSYQPILPFAFAAYDMEGKACFPIV